MSLSQMQVFNEFIMPATIETLAQRIAIFNEASRGAIRLTTDGFVGDFFQESFFQSLAAARRRVDRYTANNAAPITDLTELRRSAVKIAGGFGPVRYEPSQMTWLERPSVEGTEKASSAFADLLLQDQLNTALRALVAAIENQPQLVASGAANSPPGIDYGTINNAHAKFGDASQQIVADVMSGGMYHKLIGQNLANATTLFQSGNVTVVDILGKSVVITDSPALTEASAASPPGPSTDKVLGLVTDAAVVFDGSDVISNIETVNGKLRIETTLQIDYAFGLSLKGYTWDETAGGKSPTDAELASGANWDKVMVEDKHTAGVLATSD
jgi:hypothetical protein